MVIDGDHDFEGPRAPEAHLDTVKYNTVESPAQALYITHRKLFRPSVAASLEPRLPETCPAR